MMKREAIPFRNLLPILFSLLFFAGCAKTPVTERSQFIVISSSQEMRLGMQESSKIKQSARISKDKALNEKIASIGRRIADVAERPDFEWEFTVIDDDTVNAFCLPGGKVFFYTGILKLMENDDQIATVMGHEIAHALARHGAERMSMQIVSDVGAQALAIALDIPPEYENLYEQAYGITSQVGVMLPYSRKFEFEADQIGIYLMWKAGYDPQQAVRFWERMKAASKGPKPPAFLSTHPSDDARIAEIKAFISTLPDEGERPKKQQ
jgi:predicted Zn-dependent protease